MTTLIRYKGNKKSISIGVGEFSGQFKPAVTAEVDPRFAEYLLSTGDFEVATGSAKTSAPPPAKTAVENKPATGDQPQDAKTEGER
jgi:hypothetical protein